MGLGSLVKCLARQIWISIGNPSVEGGGGDRDGMDETECRDFLTSLAEMSIEERSSNIGLAFTYFLPLKDPFINF